MSALYLYNFTDGQYIVDDYGQRWTPLTIATKEGTLEGSTTVICDSCHEPVTAALQLSHGHISCYDCVDITNIDLAGENFPDNMLMLDYGMGQYDLMDKANIIVAEDHGEDMVLFIPTCDRVDNPSRWRDIMMGGVIYGYQYMGEIEETEVTDASEF